MSESGFIVCVPEAEPVVGELRRRYDPSVKLGVPAHVTVLFPFMAPDRIVASTLQRVRTVVDTIEAFDFSLSAAARFSATAYLAPQPAAPFIALTERLACEFPEFPPFAAEFPSIIPHLTVAHGNAAEAERAHAELVTALAAHGPIRSTCASLVLIENASGRWRQMHAFALGHRHPGG